MNISAAFIRRPVMTTLLMAALVIFGVFGYATLPVSELPKVDFPNHHGVGQPAGRRSDDHGLGRGHAAGKPVLHHPRRQLDDLAKLVRAQTRITIQFDLDRNIDAAAEDVQAAIQAASRQLPVNMPSPPTLRKVNPADAPIIYLAMQSRTRCRSTSWTNMPKICWPASFPP